MLGGTGTGTTGALPALQFPPAGAVLARGEPCAGQGGTAPIMSRGGMPVARYERRWGAAGRREKQQTGRTPGRARRVGQAGGAAQIRPAITEEGHTPQEKWPPAHCGREATCVCPGTADAGRP
jgi:hypothetical protein